MGPKSKDLGMQIKAAQDSPFSALSIDVSHSPWAVTTHAAIDSLLLTVIDSENP